MKCRITRQKKPYLLYLLHLEEDIVGTKVHVHFNIANIGLAFKWQISCGVFTLHVHKLLFILPSLVHYETRMHRSTIGSCKLTCREQICFFFSAQFLTVLKTSSININSCVVYADVCTCWLSLHIISYNIQQTFLMAAQKRKRNRSSNYLISVDQHDLNRGSDSTVAKLRYVPQTKRSSW